MKKLFCCYLSLFIIIAAISCKEDTPVNTENNNLFDMQVLGASVTESFIHIKINQTINDALVNVYRNNSIICSFPAVKKDTVIVDSLLAEAAQYEYKAELYQGDLKLISKSGKLQTMNVSGSNFTWEEYRFGDYYSSRYRDVEIIDNNNIWLAGELYFNDGYGNEEKVKGTSNYKNGVWTHYKLMGSDPFNPQYNNNPPREIPGAGIILNNKNEIIAISGIHFFKFNGSIFQERNNIRREVGLEIFNAGIRNICQTKNGGYYFGASDGIIYHHNGKHFTKIETGTNYNIMDIRAEVNPITGKDEVLAVGTRMLEGNGVGALFRVDSSNAEAENILGINDYMAGVWYKSGMKYFIGGGSAFSNYFGFNKGWKQLLNEINNYGFIFSVDANDLNDIFTVGHYGEIQHFNGKKWTNISNKLAKWDIHLETVRFKENTVVAAGYGDDKKAVVLIGRRN